MVRKKYVIPLLAVILIIGVSALWGQDIIRKVFFRPTQSVVEDGNTAGNGGQDIVTVAKRLNVPWEMDFLPDGDMLVTERPGTLRRIGQDGQTYVIEGVEQTSEGGLLGLALDPRFAENSRLYLYMTTIAGDTLTNRVERYVYENGKLSARTVILADIPGSANHDGGRIAFGPDGNLYITTGDAGRPALAQDTASLAGKILRITADGSPAPGNPFNNEVYSYGHRNPQGLAWDDKGRLWSTEHGRSGTQSGFDELNQIRAGINYGWPEIEGDETRQGMQTPAAHSGANETWAPASLAYADGSLFFGGLRGQSLYQAHIIGDSSLELSAHFREEFGRLRAVTVHEENIYLATSNTDGRGEPSNDDDQIFSIKRTVFK